MNQNTLLHPSVVQINLRTFRESQVKKDTPITYTLTERDDNVNKPSIKNYIEINGETIPMESLPDEKIVQISLLLQDTFMEALGYQRKKDSD